MVAITNNPNDPSLILVTGASGFLAAWIVRTLLERGYAVRGTVRSHSKGEYLQNLFKEYGSKFSYIIVDDVRRGDVWEAPLKNVDAVIHTASQVTASADDPKELIDTAVGGITSVLNAVKGLGPTVKRVVYTSSTGTLLEPHEGVYVHTEADWNHFAVKQTELFGRKTEPGILKYRASKVLAEQALWNFTKGNKDITFDAVAIIPSYIWGPIIHEVPSADKINMSMGQFFYEPIQNLITKPDWKSQNQLFEFYQHNVDVRDVAEAHVRAMESPVAGGERFIVSNRPCCLQDFLDAINTADPLLPRSKVPVGEPGGGKAAASTYTRIYDNSKGKKVLGLTYTSFDKTVRDGIISLRERGF